MRYQDELKRSNALDFDDLIMLTVKLFDNNPKLLEKYQEKFAYILVDEFQDTNFAQYQLLKLLASARKKICVVGDDDQSIYRFRGANVQNILNFDDDFPGAKVIKLEQNYRSTQHILNVSGAVIAQNPIKEDRRNSGRTEVPGKKCISAGSIRMKMRPNILQRPSKNTI